MSEDIKNINNTNSDFDLDLELKIYSEKCEDFAQFIIENNCKQRKTNIDG